MLLPNASGPLRHVEVDVARLLLILRRFGEAPSAAVQEMQCWPNRPVILYFTPEYRLQKIDFLLRYPAYFAYELIELHRMRIPSASDRTSVIGIINKILGEKEPERRTDLYRKFLRGAYEQLDRVEAFWHSRHLIYTGTEPRGPFYSGSRPQKYYFLTTEAVNLADTLAREVDHARWYAERISLIHDYFGDLPASRLKTLQYSHQAYREAQIAELIPDLPQEEIAANFERVFGEPLRVNFDE
ncbi:MAG: hypothetical protein JWL77_6778 [Chthonomonadaceae bacterium]|nr:hypothetical protein [Chthonomonadaceae bacterium]